jgi:Domain of unknown function (DUF4387)
MRLWESASLIRSKNAGPFVLTFDIMFPDRQTYEKVRDSGVLDREVVAAIYGVPVQDVDGYACDNALALKFSIPRRLPQGHYGDGDMHGGQQYAPLLDIEVPQ